MGSRPWLFVFGPIGVEAPSPQGGPAKTFHFLFARRMRKGPRDRPDVSGRQPVKGQI